MSVVGGVWKPSSVCCGMSESIFVSDEQNHQIRWMFRKGNSILIGKKGERAGEFNAPSGLAFDASLKRLVVCDKFNHRLQIFTIITTSREISSKESSASSPSVLLKPSLIIGGRRQGAAADEFNLPLDCAIGKNSEIAVTDYRNQRVQVFRKTGCLIATCRVREPRSVAFTPSNNRLIVSATHSILVINRVTMTMVQAIGHFGSAIGHFKFPRGIAIDASGNIVIADTGNARIQILRENYHPAHCIKVKQHENPIDVAVSNHNNRLLVLTINNKLLFY